MFPRGVGSSLWLVISQLLEVRHGHLPALPLVVDAGAARAVAQQRRGGRGPRPRPRPDPRPGLGRAAARSPRGAERVGNVEEGQNPTPVLDNV